MKFFKGLKKRAGAKADPPERPPVQDNKIMLKHARTCIDGGRLGEAQKYCKKVLRKDKLNYMALVLLGKCLKTNENAVKTFQRAIELRANHPLAWQGLADYYERKGEVDGQNQLLGIYEKILMLPNVEESYLSKTLQKYGKLSISMKYTHSIRTLINYISKGCNNNLIKEAEERFFDILREVKCEGEELSEAIKLLKTITIKYTDDEKFQLLLGELVFRRYTFAAAMKEIIALGILPGSIHIKQMLCEILCQRFMTHQNFANFNIERYFYKLTLGIQHTRYAKFLNVILIWKNINKMEAFRICIDMIKDVDFDPKPEIIFLLNCSKIIGEVYLTENLVSFFIGSPGMKDPDVVYLAYITLIKVYLHNGRCYETINVLKKIPIGLMDAELLLNLGNMYCKVTIDINVIKSILASTDYLDWFRALEHLKYYRYEEAISILRSYDKHPLKYYYIGYAYWHNNQQALCLENLQKALELLPNVAKIYSSLGIYYYDYENNTKEGREYLEKSYNMCSNDIETIKLLSVIYDQLNYERLELNLLQNSVNIAAKTDTFWIYTRLSRLYYYNGSVRHAIIWLSEGIKINPQDVTAHEWVGDIYCNAKAYDQAIAVFEKVVTMTNNTALIIKCFLKIGFMYMAQKRTEEAIIMYDNVLRVEPDNNTAVKNVTQNRLVLAKKLLAEHSYSAAREVAQAGITNMTSAISIDNASTDYKHLFGDFLILISRLPEEHCYIKLQEGEEEIERSGKIAMYQMAIENYSNVAKLRDSFALYKCAHTYFLYYFETKHIPFCQTSYNLAVLCVKNNPNAWHYWDLLGKLCYFSQKYKEAHYCFLKAISLNENKSVSIIWCNLGVLYLKMQKERLANHCFTVGRDSLPPYPRTWIGDGLLAEIIQEEGNIGLFTPAPISITNVINHDYVDWMSLINEMSSPQNEPTFSSPMEALRIVPNSTDIIEWYLSFEQETAWVCTAMGQIQEGKGMPQLALIYYQRAYAMADEAEKKEILFHQARVLMKMSQYNDAIKVHSGNDQVNLRAAVGLANALLKEKCDEDAFIAYHIALTEHCITDKQRIKILITMSNVGYRMKGLHFAFCVMQQAERVQRVSRGSGFDIPFLKCYVFGKVYDDLVLYLMQEKLHEHIDEAMWWYYLGVNHLKRTNKFAKVACMCIRMAIELGKNSEHYDVIGKMHALISIAEFYGGDKDAALSYAKEALKMYPEQQELWAALILCVYSHREWPHRVLWILRALYNVRLCIRLSRPIKEWLMNLEMKLLRN